VGLDRVVPRTLQPVLAAGGAVAAWHVGPAATWLPPVRRLLPRLAGRGGRAHVALTFDDGPAPGSTPAVAATLAELRLRATFFVLGAELARHRELGRELVDAGHELAVHGWDHGYLLGRGPRRVRDELARTRDLVGELTGAAPSWFRPAFGVLTGPALRAGQALGLRPVLWTVWGKDWAPSATAESIVGRLASGLTGGATVLLHDADPAGTARRATAEALPRLAALAAARGLTLGPLAEHELRPGPRVAP
jgi:peptidoglycan/xylan/chitin deacetylase (PgdA/CDA1 family)